MSDYTVTVYNILTDTNNEHFYLFLLSITSLRDCARVCLLVIYIYKYNTVYNISPKSALLILFISVYYYTSAFCTFTLFLHLHISCRGVWALQWGGMQFAHSAIRMHTGNAPRDNHHHTKENT